MAGGRRRRPLGPLSPTLPLLRPRQDLQTNRPLHHPLRFHRRCTHPGLIKNALLNVHFLLAFQCVIPHLLVPAPVLPDPFLFPLSLLGIDLYSNGVVQALFFTGKIA